MPRMLYRLKNFILPIFVAASLQACNDHSSSDAYHPAFSPDTTARTLVVGFPSFSFSEYADLFVKYLNDHVPGTRFKIKACTTYEEYLDDVEHQKFDLTLMGGILALDATRNGYTIVGKLSDDDQYTGCVFIRKNAGIEKIGDLKGRSLALPPFNNIPGTMMPLYYLQQNGLDVNHDIRRVNVPSFESAVMNTYMGKTDAGLCLTRNWKLYTRQHPEILTKLAIAWETPPQINNAILVKKNMDSATLSKLLTVLFKMHNSEQGKKALMSLDIKSFETADTNTYKPIMEFKKKYDETIL